VSPPATVPPAEVVVEGERPKPDERDVSLRASEARRAPGTANDPLKVVDDLPGLARAPLGSTALVLWGADPRASRVFVDGVEIPALFHGAALRSTVNGDLVERITVAPGAYDADFGGGIGGLVRLETRSLPPVGAHADIEVSTLDASAFTSAALGERVRGAVGARYGYADRVLDALGADDRADFFAVPRYADYQAKLEISLRQRESLAAVFLGSHDDYSRAVPDSDPAHGQSVATSDDFQRCYLVYRRTALDGATSELVPSLGHDRHDYGARFGGVTSDRGESGWRWGLRASHRAPLAPGVTFSLGANVTGSHAELTRAGSLTIPPREGDGGIFGQPPGDDATADVWHTAVVDVAPYAAVELAAGPLSVTPALRVDGYLVEASRQTPRLGQTPAIGRSSFLVEVEPRVRARLVLSRRVALSGAFGFYSQPPAAAELSAVFGSPTLRPERALHATLGESVAITETLSSSLLGFYERMTELTVRHASPNPPLARVLENDGEGRSFGVSLWLRQQPFHGWFGWLAVTLSRSERRDPPATSYRPFDGDESVVATFVAGKRLGPWSVGGRFRYATGLPRTPVTGAIYDERDDVYQPLTGTVNGSRLPNFWQLDARVDRSFALGEGRTLALFVEGMNLTNHENTEELAYSFDYSERKALTGLPIVAVLGARLEL